MRTGLTKQEKTTDIWFDKKEPLIYIRTHNTDLKNRLSAYATAHPGECRQTAAGRQARQRKRAAFREKTLDGKIIMFDKFTWQRYNNDKKTWKGAILFNE